MTYGQGHQICCSFKDSRSQIIAQNLPICTSWLSIYEKGQTFRQTECHCPLATVTASNNPTPSAHRSSLECELPSSRTDHVSMSGGARAGTGVYCQTLGTWEWKLVPRQQAETWLPLLCPDPARNLVPCSLMLFPVSRAAEMGQPVKRLQYRQA